MNIALKYYMSLGIINDSLSKRTLEVSDRCMATKSTCDELLDS